MASAARFRVALVSLCHVPGKPAANLARHRQWLARALRSHPDFVCFAEFALTGWV